VVVPQTTSPDFGQIAQWVQYGVLGLVVVGFLVGWIWARPAVQSIQAELAGAKQELRETKDELRLLHAYTREVIVPAVTTSNEAVKDANRLVRTLVQQGRGDKDPV
jgi:uncharacterized membrane-anchored protein YhcB (DUF1043 family)